MNFSNCQTTSSTFHLFLLYKRLAHGGAYVQISRSWRSPPAWCLPQYYGNLSTHACYQWSPLDPQSPEEKVEQVYIYSTRIKEALEMNRRIQELLVWEGWIAPSSPRNEWVFISHAHHRWTPPVCLQQALHHTQWPHPQGKCRYCQLLPDLNSTNMQWDNRWKYAPAELMDVFALTSYILTSMLTNLYLESKKLSGNWGNKF